MINKYVKKYRPVKNFIISTYTINTVSLQFEEELREHDHFKIIFKIHLQYAIQFYRNFWLTQITST